jgi:hypothetical protein
MDACGRAKEQIKEIREVWFPDHSVSFHHITAPDDATPGRLMGWTDTVHWKKPGTGVFAIELVISGPTLYVSGDLGGAVYRWSADVHWVQFGRFSLDYFAGKCIASEEGREYTDWDEEVAEAYLERYFNDLGQHNDSHVIAHDAREAWNAAKVPECLSSRFEWNAWLHGSDPHSIFGDAWYEWLPNIGKVFNMRCIAHWVATRMIAEKLS